MAHSAVRRILIALLVCSLGGCVSNVCGNTGSLDQDAQAYCENQTRQANFERGQEIGATLREATDAAANGIVWALGFQDPQFNAPALYSPAVPGSSPGETIVAPAFAPGGNRLDPDYVPPPPVQMSGFSQVIRPAPPVPVGPLVVP
jgi:hypothetical protein